MRFRHQSNRVFSPCQIDQRARAGLVCHYIGSGSGQQIFDYSGVRNHGTINGATWSLGRKQSMPVLQFDGVNDYVDTATTATGDSLSAVGTALTLSCWVWSNLDTGAAQMFVTKPVAAAAHTNPYFLYSLQSINGANYVRFAVDTTGLSFSEAANCVVSANGTMVYGQWIHIAGTYDGALLRLYLNGSLVNTAVHLLDIRETATPLRLGANGGFGELLNGRLEDVRVYNRVLSDAEIALIASPDFYVIQRTSHRNSILPVDIPYPRNGDFFFAGF